MKPRSRKSAASFSDCIAEYRHPCLCAERAFSLLREDGLQVCLAHSSGGLSSATAMKCAECTFDRIEDCITFIDDSLKSRNLTGVPLNNVHTIYFLDAAIAQRFPTFSALKSL